MAKAKRKKAARKKYPERAAEVPVTQAMLFEVRGDLRASIQETAHKLESRFGHVDARMLQVDARFNQMEARFDHVDSELHQMKLLLEEQNARNAIVLDGLTSLFARQERLEKKVDRLG